MTLGRINIYIGQHLKLLANAEHESIDVRIATLEQIVLSAQEYAEQLRSRPKEAPELEPLTPNQV